MTHIGDTHKLRGRGMLLRRVVKDDDSSGDHQGSEDQPRQPPSPDAARAAKLYNLGVEPRLLLASAAAAFWA
jgi:hypothetical protein